MDNKKIARELVRIAKILSAKRSLSDIADEIYDNWENIHNGALPYLKAMSTLENIDDDYYKDSGREIVNRFLVYARFWKGETARRIKAELNQMLKI